MIKFTSCHVTSSLTDICVLVFWTDCYFKSSQCHCQDHNIDNDDTDGNQVDTQAPEIDSAAADPEIQAGLDEEPAAAEEVAGLEPVEAGPALEAPQVALPEIASAEPELPDVAEPAGPAGPSAPSGVAAPVPGIPRLRVHASPFEILEQGSPNSTFKIGINHNDHRFYVKCKVKAADDDRITAPYHNQSFSRTFHLATEGSWKEALAEVHDHCWHKWELIKSDHPADKEVQVPGRAPDYVIDQMEAYMATSMPERKEYGSKRSGV